MGDEKLLKSKDKIENLLEQVSFINKKYQKIAELTGEKFNIFKILGIERKEVITHSTFIVELLNPIGSHGRGAIFLNHFVRLLDIDIEETEHAKVVPEKFIGHINNNYTEGGRIDIYIESGGKYIFIENKIDAIEQPNQLLRYFNYKPHAKLIYLTLDGTYPTEKSTGEKLEKMDYLVLSYKDFILKWLTECLKETVNQPLLRETIKQYINLIKYLTGQAMNDNMNKEIAEIFKRNPENIESAFLISNSLQNVKKSLIEDFKTKIQRIANHKNFKYTFESFEKMITGEQGFKLYKDEWSFQIGFHFEHKNLNSLYFGICKKVKSDIPEEIIDSLHKNNTILRNEEEYREKWPVWDYLSEVRDWEYNALPWIYIVSYDENGNNKMEKIIKEKIEILLELLDRCGLS